ncbi:hypothetical protein M0802_000687 [Mischocyttarus mexicanus]|nr:hypothetical protein M0802_000687 [Mischocyttarus mexicanus]
MHTTNYVFSPSSYGRTTTWKGYVIKIADAEKASFSFRFATCDNGNNDDDDNDKLRRLIEECRGEERGQGQSWG